MDHATEDYSRLIAKWHEKRNQNVHMIVAEGRDNRPRVAAVMHGRSRIRVDVIDQGIWTD
jgi:hypothetical protein